MAKSIIIDSGFWFAYFDQKDNFHNEAILHFERIVEYNILVVPWPTLYETLNTKFSRRKLWKNEFHKILKTYKVYLISDNDYREKTLTFFFNTKIELSLVDLIIRNILEDDSIRINAILTFNKADFIDICYKKGIEIPGN